MDDKTRIPPKPTLLLNRYRIDGMLGEGGLGTVYKAYDTRLKRFVAVKTLKRSVYSNDPDLFRTMEERFHREAEAGSRMHVHPNLVVVYDFVTDADKSLYLIQEFVPGGTLADRLSKEGALPQGDALRLAADVARGLAAAHEMHIVHRDIKPANIFLSADGRARVGDFGIAQLDDLSGRTRATSGHPGTPLYMSPEQAGSSGYVRAESDQYSLGLVLFEMLTGQSYKRIRKRQAEDLLSQQPQQIQTLVRRMIADDPDDRYESTMDVATEIGQIERQLAAAATQIPPAPIPIPTEGVKKHDETIIIHDLPTVREEPDVPTIVSANIAPDTARTTSAEPVISKIPPIDKEIRRETPKINSQAERQEKDRVAQEQAARERAARERAERQEKDRVAREQTEQRLREWAEQREQERAAVEDVPPISRRSVLIGAGVLAVAGATGGVFALSRGQRDATVGNPTPTAVAVTTPLPAAIATAAIPPTISPSPAARIATTAATTPQVVRVTISYATLRDLPTPTAKEITPIPEGEDVEIIDSTVFRSGFTFYHVRYHGLEGWLESDAGDFSTITKVVSSEALHVRFEIPLGYREDVQSQPQVNYPWRSPDNNEHVFVRRHPGLTGYETVDGWSRTVNNELTVALAQPGSIMTTVQPTAKTVAGFDGNIGEVTFLQNSPNVLIFETFWVGQVRADRVEIGSTCVSSHRDSVHAVLERVFATIDMNYAPP